MCQEQGFFYSDKIHDIKDTKTRGITLSTLTAFKRDMTQKKELKVKQDHTRKYYTSLTPLDQA